MVGVVIDTPVHKDMVMRILTLKIANNFNKKKKSIYELSKIVLDMINNFSLYINLLKKHMVFDYF